MNSIQSISGAQLPEKFDIVTSVPMEIGLKILSNLSKVDLLTTSLVCKNWKALAYDNSFWKDDAWKIFKNEETRQNLKNQNCFREIYLRVAQFMPRIQEGLISSEIKVLTAMEFNSLEISLDASCRLTPLTPQEEDDLGDYISAETNKKMAANEKIRDAFYKCLNLLAIKPSLYDNAFKLALCLKEFYGNDEPFLGLAKFFMLKKEYEKSFEIYDKYLKDTHQKDTFFIYYIQAHCRDGNIDTAIKCFKEHKKDIHKYKQEQCIEEDIFCHLYNKGTQEALITIEECISDLLEGDFQIDQLYELMDHYIKKNQTNEIQRLTEKFGQIIEKSKGPRRMQFISMAVEQDPAYAYRLTKNQEFDELNLMMLNRYFEMAGAHKEAEEIISRTPKKKK